MAIISSHGNRFLSLQSKHIYKLPIGPLHTRPELYFKNKPQKGLPFLLVAKAKCGKLPSVEEDNSLVSVVDTFYDSVLFEPEWPNRLFN